MSKVITNEDYFHNEVAITFEAINSVNAWLGNKKEDLSQEELDVLYEDTRLHIKAAEIYEERLAQKKVLEIQSIIEALRKEESL